MARPGERTGRMYRGKFVLNNRRSLYPLLRFDRSGNSIAGRQQTYRQLRLLETVLQVTKSSLVNRLAFILPNDGEAGEAGRDINCAWKTTRPTCPVRYTRKLASLCSKKRNRRSRRLRELRQDAMLSEESTEAKHALFYSSGCKRIRTCVDTG